MIGAASGGFNQTRENRVLELGAAEDVPLRVAVSNMGVNTIGTVGPLLRGLIAVWLGHRAIFMVCVVMQFIAFIVLVGWIPEPRAVR